MVDVQKVAFHVEMFIWQTNSYFLSQILFYLNQMQHGAYFKLKSLFPNLAKINKKIDTKLNW